MLQMIKFDPKSAVQYHYLAISAVAKQPVYADIQAFMPEKTFEGTGTILISCKSVLNGLSTHDQDGYSIMFRPQACLLPWSSAAL